MASEVIEAPWGDDGTLRLTFPAMWNVGRESVVEPDLRGAVDDYPEALAAALDAPLDAPRLETLVRPGAKIAIVVDDPSRWTPVREALPTVLARLHAAGAAVEDVSISVGVGRHHAVDDAAMRRRLGDGPATTYRCYSPPVDDLSAYVDLGTTERGIPVRVFRPVAEADVRILIGSVLPHLQAGFGGGYKLIFPGTSHRTTLGALHRQGLSRDSDAGLLLGGPAAENPMRQAVNEAAALLGPCVSISHLIGAPGMIFRVCSGRPESVQDALAAEATSRFQAPPAAPADVVVVGNNPWPGDPMQSFKAFFHHLAAGAPGGITVGLFWTDPDEIDRSMPRSAMRLIAGSGAPGAWMIRRLLPGIERILSARESSAAFMLRWARELVVDRTVMVYAPPLHARIGGRLGPVRLFADQDALWKAVHKALPRERRDSPRVRVFPRGGLTYAPQRCDPRLPFMVMLRDDPVVVLFDSPYRPPGWIEAIDVDNGEYKFCDEHGQRYVGVVTRRIEGSDWPLEFELKPDGDPDVANVLELITQAKTLEPNPRFADLDALRRHLLRKDDANGGR